MQVMSNCMEIVWEQPGPKSDTSICAVPGGFIVAYDDVTVHSKAGPTERMFFVNYAWAGGTVPLPGLDMREDGLVREYIIQKSTKL